MWGHLKRDDEKFEFTKENRLMEILYSNNRENRVKWNTLAFHVLPLLSITEFLFSNVGFVKEVVECTMPYLNKDGVLEKLKWELIEQFVMVAAQQKRPWRVIVRAASRSGGGVGGGCCGGGVVVVVVEGVVGRENLHWVKLWEVVEEKKRWRIRMSCEGCEAIVVVAAVAVVEECWGGVVGGGCCRWG
ncbi:Glycoside hydrolase family 81 protein [Arachis hypogaea]|nr:Glycoside hydrolase family 81 protein [Arachis hypogaea]